MAPSWKQGDGRARAINLQAWKDLSLSCKALVRLWGVQEGPRDPCLQSWVAGSQRLSLGLGEDKRARV